MGTLVAAIRLPAGRLTTPKTLRPLV